MRQRSIVLHPILLAIYPFLFFFAHNIGRIGLGAIILPVVITVCLTILAWSVLALALKDSKKSAVLVSLFLLMFFSYRHVSRAVDGILGASFRIGSLTIAMTYLLLIVWLALFSFGLIFFLRSRKGFKGITTFLNFLSICLILFPLFSIGVYEIRIAGAWREDKMLSPKPARSVETLKKISGVKGGTVEKPNIYYIVVDAYAGGGILKEVYGYDNSAFLNYLAEKGFYVADASLSNYSQTALSLGSSLNLQYLDSILSRVNRESNNMDIVKRMIKHNDVFRFLKKRGYRIVAFASGRDETEIKNADIYIASGYSFDEAKSELANITPLREVFKAGGEDPRYEIHRKRLLYLFDHIADTTKIKGPVFVFAHIELPHPPFVFGANGEEIRGKGLFTDNDGSWLIKKGSLTNDEYIKGYGEQLSFLNKKLRAVIETILRHSKEMPIIVLQSDHGPRSRVVWHSPERTYFKECLSILNAYYFPDQDYRYLYDSITPVNTFRLILRQYFGADYGLLKDEEYFSTAYSPYTFIDVTDKMK